MRWFWIDRFTQFVTGQQATAQKCVSLGEDHLHDHLLGFPIMPNSLVTEGIAQAGGLLVSEFYRFQELVVLGKVSNASFHGLVRPGQILTYEVVIDTLREDGAAVSAMAYVEGRLQAEVQLFFARMDKAGPKTAEMRLFRQRDLLYWLSLVGVFEVGEHPDGTRLRPSDYFDIDQLTPTGLGNGEVAGLPWGNRVAKGGLEEPAQNKEALCDGAS